jgi:hypothetical protein
MYAHTKESGSENLASVEAGSIVLSTRFHMGKTEI